MAVETRAIMYGFWASSCSWRVRAALHMKRIPFEERKVDIVKAMTQHYRTINPSQKVPALIIGSREPCLQEFNVPHQDGVSCDFTDYLLSLSTPKAFYSLLNLAANQIQEVDGMTLVESMAIIQYLEDTRPQPPLMPKSPLLRAQARIISETIVSGIQPLQNIGLKSQFETEEQFLKFAKHFTKEGLQSLENFLEKSAGKYCVGDKISIADLCLVPQIYNCVTRYDSPGLFKIQETKEAPTQTWREMVAEKFPTVSEVYDNLLKEKIFMETHPKNIKTKIVQ